MLNSACSGYFQPSHVNVRSKAWVCGRSLAGTAGSNLAGGMEWVLHCVVRQRSLRRAVQSSRGVLPSVVRLSVIKEPHRGLGTLGLSSHKKKWILRSTHSNSSIIWLIKWYSRKYIYLLRNIRGKHFENCFLSSDITGMHVKTYFLKFKKYGILNYINKKSLTTEINLSGSILKIYTLVT
jgi:hypothetical protein